MKFKAFLVLMILFFVMPLFASRNISWCEVDVSLTKSGRQIIIYKVKWSFPGDTMSGFDMQGFDKAQPFFDYENSTVYENGSTNRRKIKIGKGDSNGLYPIDIDGGDRLKESAIWVIKYATDFYGAGYEGYTTTDKGEKLVFLNWSPLIWDQGMEHYTVYWHFPYEVSGEKVTDEEKAKFRIRTEKAIMNDSGYLIDYKGQKDDNGKYWFTMIVHKNNPYTKFDFRQQFYVPAEFFDLKDYDYDSLEKDEQGKVVKEGVNKTKDIWKKNGKYIIAGLILLFGLTFLKRGNKAPVGGPNWSDTEWDSPRIGLSGFRSESVV